MVGWSEQDMENGKEGESAEELSRITLTKNTHEKVLVVNFKVEYQLRKQELKNHSPAITVTN